MLDDGMAADAVRSADERHLGRLGNVERVAHLAG